MGSLEGSTEYIFPRDETGLVCLPTQLERTLQLYSTGDGKCKERGGRAPPTLTSQGQFYPYHWMYARKQRLQLCVLCAGSLRQINPLQQRWRHFAFVSVELISPCLYLRTVFWIYVIFVNLFIFPINVSRVVNICENEKRLLVRTLNLVYGGGQDCDVSGTVGTQPAHILPTQYYLFIPQMLTEYVVK
jgi:hypothetical protein